VSSIKNIFIAESNQSPMVSISSADLISGQGVVGDRYFKGTGTFSKQLAGLPDVELTLIESEEIDAFNNKLNYQFDYGEFRRNIVTTGVRLNDLVGKEFTIGNVRLKGIRLCEPCAHLASILTKDIMPELVHRTGLRVQILKDGTIKVGDQFASL
jgi:MOSC domain-containing protein YiiM